MLSANQSYKSSPDKFEKTGNWCMCCCMMCLCGEADLR